MTENQIPKLPCQNKLKGHPIGRSKICNRCYKNRKLFYLVRKDEQFNIWKQIAVKTTKG